MQRVVGAVVVLGMICLGTLLGEWMLPVRPSAVDTTSVVFPADSIRIAPTVPPRSVHSAPASFTSNPLRFLSRAPADSLDLLPGIGPVLAARIMQAREARNGFSSWQEVLAVKGIGPRLIARWQSLSTRQ